MHQLRETDFLRLSQIIGNPKVVPLIPPVIPVCKSIWWAGVKSGRYPQPVKISPRYTAWKAEDIRALIGIGTRGATMSYANPTRGHKPFAFKRDRLPNPAKYYSEHALKLPNAPWKSPSSEAEALFYPNEHGA